MKSTVSHWRCRQLVYGMVALLAFPCGPARAAGIPVTGQQSDTPPSSASQPSPQSPVAPGPQTSAPPVSSAATPAQSGQQAPVGTAAAPYENKIGVAASRPAGVVIAPAKQKRERSLVIKVGLIVGGAIAVGTVVGLSAASSSRPH